MPITIIGSGAQSLLPNVDPQRIADVMLARAESRVTGGVTGMPALQQMTSYSPDTQYGVRLPDTLVQTFSLETPILERIFAIGGRNVTRPERAAVFGQYTALDFTGGARGSFPIGGDPQGIKSARNYGSVVKKSYGALASITDVDAVATGAPGYPTRLGTSPYSNEKALLIAGTAQKTMTALEFSVIKGDQVTYPTEFDGIEKSLTVGAGHPFVRDMAGAQGWAVAQYLDTVLLEQQSYGVTPTALWMHPLAKQALTRAYLGQSGYVININQGDNQMTLGQQVRSILTAVGELPIFESTHFSLGGTAPNFSADIFIEVARVQGVPLLQFEWQIPPTALDLARVPGYYTSDVFGTWCHGVLVEKSNWWAQGRLLNVGVPWAPAYNPQQFKP